MRATALLRRLLNGAWVASCSRELARFRLAAGCVERAQAEALLSTVRRNAATRFGRQHGFDRIRTVADYRRSVPVTPYAALAPYLEAVARGERHVLTADPVERFQPTSGSTSGTKFIPWTAGLARDFRRGIDPWIASLYRSHPGLLRGTAYWSISPPAPVPQHFGRLPVGFDHDAEYLGLLGRLLFPLVNAVPLDAARAPDVARFRTRTLAALLADDQLALISVWSPTFLTTLLDDLHARPGAILDALRRCRGRAAAKRAAFLAGLDWKTPEPGLFQRVWPNLEAISCWADGPSALCAARLRERFPHVFLQGKGLIATEAFVSFPLDDAPDPVLSVRSHFFEFEQPDTGAIALAHELAAGQEYNVIVTTGGGLYRYPLGDRIRVTGFFRQAPCFRFVGRGGAVSDLFGEKLEAQFVEAVVSRLLASRDIRPRFFLVAPAADAAGQTGYTLFLQAEGFAGPAALALELDAGLAANFHYAHCRRLGQLGPARLFLIDRLCPADSVFTDALLARGQKVGDVKMAFLDAGTGWERRFRGSFV